MSFDELEALVESLRYKPKTTLTVTHDPLHGVVFDMCATVVDVLSPHGEAALHREKILTEDDLAVMSRRDILDFIFMELVMDLECHEATEWFTSHGVRVYQPHTEAS